MIDKLHIAKAYKQQGLSFIGFILVIGLTLFAIYIGVRIAPMYLEYYSVVSILSDLESEKGAARLSEFEIRTRVLSQLNLNYTENIKESNITLRGGDGVKLRIKYEVRKSIIGNLDAVAHFDKSVKLSY